MVNPPACSDPGNYRGILLLGFIFLFLPAVFCVPNGYAVDHATFSWRANPQDDAVIGYRLYYGSSSRYDNSGRLKSNFKYDVYIDFAEEEVCHFTASSPVCTPYEDSLVSCEDLGGEHPRCTLHKLNGWKFFTMTAYNTQAESSYTTELKAYFDSSLSIPYSSSGPPNNPAARAAVLGTLHAVYTILLKDI